MQDKRNHTRYRLDLIEVNGRMSLTDKVEIIDISLSGLALKADRRLNIGREYIVKLHEEGKDIEVKGVVVRSELTGFETHENGDQVSVYTAAMMFKEGFEKKIKDFLAPIEHSLQPNFPSTVEHRYHVRFHITGPRENVLQYPSHFKVQAISLGGMQIRTEQALDIEDRVPMELSFNTSTPINFIGRVASRKRAADSQGGEVFEIGVEFTGLQDSDRHSLLTFMDYLASPAGIPLQAEDPEKRMPGPAHGTS